MCKQCAVFNMNEQHKIQDLSLGNVSHDTTVIKTAQDQTSVYLVETFYITSKKNTVFQVRLTEKGLSLRKKSNGSSKEQTILLEDIIGCRCLRSKRKPRNATTSCACSSLPGGQAPLRVVEDSSVDLDETDVSAYLYIYAYILKKNRRGGHRERTTLTLRFRSFDKYEDNNKEAQKWRAAIKKLLTDKVSASPYGYTMKDMRKVLILINPKSGSGKARETFQQRVAPIFIEAEIPYEMHVTKHANYAREFVRNKDVHVYKYIVVVGGDGMYYEVINGLFERCDWERAVGEICVGIIPCGSGNGLARSIAHSFNEPYNKPILSASLTNVRGQCTSIDLVRVETKSQIMFSFLSVGWGLISDIDIESERLRLIGYPRFTLWSIHRLINLRTYHGTVSYLPASNYKLDQSNQQNYIYKTNLKHSMSCGTTLECLECRQDGECEACDTGFGDVLSLETGASVVDSFRPRLDSWYSVNSRKSAYFSTSDSFYQSVAEKLSNIGSDCIDSNIPAQMYGPAATIPILLQPVPDTWTIETGEFLMVHAVSQTHISSDCFFAPSSHLNDGVIWLCIIRGGASRKELFKFFLGMSSGTHLPNVPSEFIKMIPVVAFRIEPNIDSTEGKYGHLTVDGERVEYGAIQGEVFPSIAKVMVPNFSL